VKATKRKSGTRAKKAKRMKPPTRMVKTAGAKKSSFKHASKRIELAPATRKRFLIAGSATLELVLITPKNLV
jgi:hypothetical protein